MNDGKVVASRLTTGAAIIAATAATVAKENMSVFVFQFEFARYRDEAHRLSDVSTSQCYVCTKVTDAMGAQSNAMWIWPPRRAGDKGSLADAQPLHSQELKGETRLRARVCLVRLFVRER
jgi:hypothetical protein